MIVCLYGATCAPLVEPVARELERAAAERAAAIVPLTIEAALREPWRWHGTERLYVLPFDVPPDLPQSYPAEPHALLRRLFPHAQVANPLPVHELCWDKIAVSQRLLARGVPVPDTLITDDPAEARAFIREHQHAVLKTPRSCGGEGHLVTMVDVEGSIVGETRGRRYVVELEPEATARRLSNGVMSWPPPFYVQRLVAGVGRRGVLTPAQILRAYVVDGQVMFWTERYRARVQRPSDFIISVALGARYRFLPHASEEARKVALRAAEVLDVRVGVVDLIRTGSEGPYVLELDTDGVYMMIDRQFVAMPEFRSTFDFDRFIAEMLTTAVPDTKTRVLV